MNSLLRLRVGGSMFEPASGVPASPTPGTANQVGRATGGWPQLTPITLHAAPLHL